jgi:5'-nucleotidase
MRDRRRNHRGLSGAIVLTCLFALAGCSSGKVASVSKPTIPPSERTLSILVTNDDGVGAPGINAVVQGLRALPHTKVTVVAPLANQSGTGGKTTPGTLIATKATTAAGYPAWAVHGYPADTITWAIGQHGIAFRPDLVVSGINFGQNIGPLAEGSGTVGAAQAAVRRGIPALAASQGIDNGLGPDFSEGVTQVDDWIASHRTALVDHTYGKVVPSGNLNIPTCSGGSVRGPVNAPLGTSITGVNIGTVNCASTSTSFSDDVEAFVNGYAVIAPLGQARRANRVRRSISVRGRERSGDVADGPGAGRPSPEGSRDRPLRRREEDASDSSSPSVFRTVVRARGRLRGPVSPPWRPRPGLRPTVGRVWPQRRGARRRSTSGYSCSESSGRHRSRREDRSGPAT